VAIKKLNNLLICITGRKNYDTEIKKNTMVMMIYASTKFYDFDW
jgi:hypothetical protein